MDRLDIYHHHVIAILLVLLVFVSGVFFGVKLSGATRGTDGMIIIVFSLCFLTIVMLFLLFTQIIHIRDKIFESTVSKPKRR